MGIFRTPTEVASKSVLPEIFFLAWITGAIISFIGALTFAEIGSRYPVAGGFYKIFSHCYHPAFAFMVNWITVISNAASTAGVAIMGAEYIAPILFPKLSPSISIQLITLFSVAVLFFVNLRGIRISAKVLTGLMFIKVGMILLLIAAMFFIPPAKNVEAVVPSTFSDTDYLKAFLVCFIPVFFTYGGYQQTMNFGGDIKDARRTLPKAVFLGISIVLFLYLAVNFAYFRVLGFSGLQQTATPAAVITGKLFGSFAHQLVS